MQAWAFGVYDLRLPLDWMRDITPAQFFELSERAYTNFFRDDSRMGQLCCLIANALSGKGGKRYDIGDFFPMHKKRIRRGRARAGREKLRGNFAALAAMGRRKKKKKDAGTS